MHMCIHGCQMIVIETSKTTNFWAHFFYNTFLYWLTILFIGIAFFYWQFYFRWVKAASETTTVLACFYDTILYRLTNLTIGITFLVASTFLYGSFHANKHVCLDMHCFCSFDNWLYDPISEIWQLMLLCICT